MQIKWGLWFYSFLTKKKLNFSRIQLTFRNHIFSWRSLKNKNSSIHLTQIWFLHQALIWFLECFSSLSPFLLLKKMKMVIFILFLFFSTRFHRCTSFLTIDSYSPIVPDSSLIAPDYDSSLTAPLIQILNWSHLILH